MCCISVIQQSQDWADRIDRAARSHYNLLAPATQTPRQLRLNLNLSAIAAQRHAASGVWGVEHPWHTAKRENSENGAKTTDGVESNNSIADSHQDRLAEGLNPCMFRMRSHTNGLKAFCITGICP